MSAELEKDLFWESSIFGILYKQLFVHPKPLPIKVSLSGNTAVITGSNSGIGFEACRQLLQIGLSRLIVAVRSQASGDTAAKKLRMEFPDVDIKVWLLDMAEYDSIVAFVRQCRSLDRIDYIILNAAMQSSTFRRHTTTGHELVFQIDYISTVLLCVLLALMLKDRVHAGTITKPPVLTIVGSDTMYLSTFSAAEPVFPRMDNPTGYSRMKQYMDSKLLLMVFIRRLAQQINPDDVIINVCNPGMVAGTGLGRNGSPNPGFVEKYAIPLFARALGRKVQSGASVYIHALLGEGKRGHGSFISDWTIKPYARLLYAKEGQVLSERLWHETMEELKFASDHGIEKLFV
ncbi:putative short-chain dehydrogenase/reductase family protein [Aspergillus brunneoviolaceus CBS 621.78]|uniref:Short-chain dehydrogenase/reductase family protein n=1 Tax=Aspergillus brunneoviolaceus CBS 621.78 TaxID=1450534 RepID=A0ACD1GK25_9EURO|nr:putative short-chain dehydrogenase/reductase family protein [Aspergillus brunneoviolaceus CBS 621.78]RAH49595.1 putative short-chain dehydrogenase/reductase family protein [Aspergillus brunneoviolaceus CBS 621.78]